MELKATRSSCPVCVSDNYKEIFRISHNSKDFINFLKIEKFYSDYFWNSLKKGLFHELNYVICECQNCSFIFQSEILNEEGMILLYNEWLDNSKLSIYYKRSIKNNHDYFLLNILKTLFKYSVEIKILDFGSGYGNFSYVAKEIGMDIFTYDISYEKNESSKQLEIKNVNNLNEYKNFFHFIYINQVLEHLANPLEVLKNLRACLVNNGMIFISTPNCKSVKKTLKSNELSEKLFEQLSPHQHINAFNNKTLKLLGQRAGFKSVFPFRFSSHNQRGLNSINFKIRLLYKYFFKTSFFFRKANDKN